jgi:hypothetical protein
MDVSPPEFESEEDFASEAGNLLSAEGVERPPDGVELFPPELRDGVLWSESCFLFMWQSELSGN